MTTGALVQTVVKLGGGLLAHRAHLAEVLRAIDNTARGRRILIVPGGGPFADAVREVDSHLHLPDDTAHQMAVLAMDQYAHLLGSQMERGVIVVCAHDIAAALAAGRIPVLAPSRWLREADPLPHTWDVTSDSIAAWVAGQVGATSLVLVKPPGLRLAGQSLPGFGEALPGLHVTDLSATGFGAVDAYFARALPAHVEPLIIPADQIEALREALGRP